VRTCSDRHKRAARHSDLFTAGQIEIAKLVARVIRSPAAHCRVFGALRYIARAEVPFEPLALVGRAKHEIIVPALGTLAAIPVVTGIGLAVVAGLLAW
jgi:hypothetical protein